MNKEAEILRAAKNEALLDVIYDAIKSGKNQFVYEEKVESIALPLPSGVTMVAFREDEESEEGYTYMIDDKVAEEIIENYMQILCYIWYPVVAYQQIQPIMYAWMWILHELQFSMLPNSAKEEIAEVIYEECKSAGAIPYEDLETIEML